MIHAIRRPMSFGGQGIALRIHDVELKLTDEEAQELADALSGAGFPGCPSMPETVTTDNTRED